MDGPTAEQVEKFLTIPCKTHKLFLNTYQNSFTGKEGVAFLISTFSLTEAEAIEFGNYLIKGDIIEQLTNRFNSNFTPKSNYIYSIQEKHNHRYFWLDELRSTLASLTRSSEDGTRFSSDEFVNTKAMYSVALPTSFKKSKSMQLANILKYVGKEICPKYDTGLFSMKLSDRRCIIVFAPEYNQVVLENAKNFVKLPEHQSSSLSVDILRLRCDTFTPAQLKLKAHYNTIILQRFTKERVYEKFLPIMIEKMSLETDDLLSQGGKSEKSPTTIDIPEFFNRTVLRILSEIFVGVDLVDHPKWSKVARYLSGNSTSKGKIKAISQMKQKNRQKYVLKALDEILQERQAERCGIAKESKSKRAVDEDILEILLNTSTILDPLNPSDEIPAALSNEVIIHSILSVLSHTHFSIVSMLSWLVNYLYDYTLGNSDLLQLLSLEIDKLSGNNPLFIPVEDISKSAPLLNGMLKETLRLNTPVPGIIRQCVEPANIGEYVATKGTVLIVSTVGTHCHPKYWEDHLRFNPFRFSSQAKQPIEAYSYIPWSGGYHRCSAGFEFSLVIGRVVMSMLLTRFELRIVSHANIIVKEGEEIPNFPNGLQVNAISRVPAKSLHRGSVEFHKQSPETGVKKSDSKRAWSGLRAMIQQKEYQLLIAAGTRERTGSTFTAASWFCERANEFQFRLGKSPYSPDEILPLLQSAEKTDFMILGICIATYQGKAAPNARHFVQWLEDTQNQIQYSSSLRSRLKHINYFVFGCGDSTWTNNYQKIAQIVDESLAALGANRIGPMGEFDSSVSDLHESYSSYYKTLAPRLMHSLPEIGSRKLRDVDSSTLMGSVSIEPQSSSSTLQMEFIGDLADSDIEPPTDLPSALANEEICECRVIKISTKGPALPDLKLSLSENSGTLPSLQEPLIEDNLHRSVELQIEVLPELEYAPGDSILVYPKVGKSVLYKFFSLFTDYDPDMVVKWTNVQKASRTFHLPLNRPLTLGNIFTSLVDLTALPTRQFLMNISTIVKDPSHESVLNRYASDTSKYQQWVKANPGIRLLDVITAYPVKSSALDRLIEFLPVLHPRAYPICSNWKYHTNYISIYISDTLAHNPTLSYILQLNQEKHSSPSIHVALRRGETISLELMEDNNCRPLVGLTRGLSIAPFISLLFNAIAEGVNVRAVIFHCLTPADSKKKFILRRSIRRLQKAGVLEEFHIFFAAQAVTIINNAHTMLWEFINNINCKLYIAGWNGASFSEIIETLIRIIQANCTPLVYRGCKDYAEAYLKQLREAERLEECWY